MDEKERSPSICIRVNRVPEYLFRLRSRIVSRRRGNDEKREVKETSELMLTAVILIKFQSNTYHSIALDLFYKLGFESKSIGRKFWLQIVENWQRCIGRHFVSRDLAGFATERAVGSSWTKKMLDRTLQDQSNGVHDDWIQLKNKWNHWKVVIKLKKLNKNKFDFKNRMRFIEWRQVAADECTSRTNVEKWQQWALMILAVSSRNEIVASSDTKWPSLRWSSLSFDLIRDVIVGPHTTAIDGLYKQQLTSQVNDTSHFWETIIRHCPLLRSIIGRILGHFFSTVVLQYKTHSL